MRGKAVLALTVLLGCALSAPLLAAGTPLFSGQAEAFGVSRALINSALCDESTAFPDTFGPSVEVPIRVPQFLTDRPRVETAPGSVGGPVSDALSPGFDLSFQGIDSDDNSQFYGFRLAPPDTEGDVSYKNYIQYNNLVLKIFRKSDGQFLLECQANVFWADSTINQSSPCFTDNAGDPIVLYDHLAGRWVASMFTFGDANGDGHQCVAVSRSASPFGRWNVWDFGSSPGTFNDYPKIGIWPTGAVNGGGDEGNGGDASMYVMTTNEFPVTEDCPFGFCGVNITVYERDAMLSASATPAFQTFRLQFTNEAPVAFSLQPPHFQGRLLPAAGTPALVTQAFDEDTWGDASGDPDGYRFWTVAVDWSNPDASSCDELPFVTTPKPFDSELCGFSRDCIPQDGTTQRLDTLGQFTMYRFHIRNYGDEFAAGPDLQVADLAGGVPAGFTVIRGGSTIGGPPVGLTGSLSHTVDAGADRAGVHWAIFDVNGIAPAGPVPAGFTAIRGGSPSIFVRDTATFAPDDLESRWMPSINMDAGGNTSIVYSKSSNNIFPSVYYTVREREDEPMTLQKESVCVDGTGFQSGTNRWGDYATVSVDPQNDCTFWVTNEYVETSGSFQWDTRICSFRVGGCDFPEISISPGIAGETNTLTVIGAVPNRVVRFFRGPRPGSTPQGGTCEGFVAGIDQAQQFGTVQSDGAGTASFSFFVPPNRSGDETLFQAFDGSCNTTNVLVHKFP